MNQLLSKLKNKMVYIILLVSVLVGYCVYAIQFNLGRPITIQITDETISNDSPVALTGIQIGEKWYSPVMMLPSQNCDILVSDNKVVILDHSPMTIRLPGNKDAVMTFSSSDNRTLEIWSGDNKINATLMPQNSEDETTYITIPSDNKINSRYISNSVVAFIVAALLFFAIYYITNRRISHYIKWGVWVIAFIISGVIIYFFSISTTPYISKELYVWGGFDSQTFALAGKVIANGGTMYLDYFDHKGPIIYFLYAISELFNSKWPVFMVQTILLGISLVYCYKISAKLSSDFAGVFSIVLALVYFVITFDEGLLTEEVNLPFLMVSTYYLISYMLDSQKHIQHNYKYSFIYGITIGVSFCLRVTNCCNIAIMILCIIIYLTLKKEYKNLLQNMVSGILGLVVVLLPFVIYFASKGALYDFFYGTLLFNIEYTIDEVDHSLIDWVRIIMYLSPVLIAGVAAFEYYKNKLLCYAIAISALVYSIYQISINVFTHYYVIAITFIPIVVGLLFGKHVNEKSIDRYKLGYYGLFLVFGIAFITLNIDTATQKFQKVYACSHSNNNTYYNNLVIQQGKLIPEEERNAVASYAISPDWYLINDIIPCYRDISAQDWRLSFSEKLYQQNLNDYRSLEAKWLVVKNDILQPEIKQVVEKFYIEVSKSLVNSDTLTLYQRIDL